MTVDILEASNATIEQLLDAMPPFIDGARSMTRSTLSMLAALVSSLVASGCSTMPTDRSAELEHRALPMEAWVKAQQAGPPPVYRLQIGDVIDVRFPQVTELNETVTLRPDGMISLTWIGDAQAAGMTPTELAAALRTAYIRVLRAPRIDVLVRTFQPPKIYVAGEVKSPGELQMIGSLSAIQAIVRTGDFTLDARRDSVIVIRQTGRPDPDYILLDFSSSDAGRMAVAATQACSEHNPLACDGIKPMRAEGFALQPMDLVFVSKTPIAGVAQFFERYVSQILPIYKNIGVSFDYQLRADRIVLPNQ